MRHYYAALMYTVLGLASGLFYREYTQAHEFTGATELGTVHTHLLGLGLTVTLVVLALDAVGVEMMRAARPEHDGPVFL